ncbi:putative Transposase [Streptomyces viridochromogenes Tue57]|uniref:Putative Transposase n=1 Tax=Streptomyces viridochromogenes Tue57 TaxID=1160705 RepID=L8P4R1_STRVR|nr:putative Transposase [Streptomyces viridochromogenes Tue57]
MEVVPAEALASAVLPRGVSWQWSGDGDLVLPGGLLQVDQGGVAAVDQVLGGQRNDPSTPVDHAAAPGSPKIPDGVKLKAAYQGVG